MKVGDLVEHKQPWDELLGVIIKVDDWYDSEDHYCQVQWTGGIIDWYPAYYLWKVTDESR